LAAVCEHAATSGRGGVVGQDELPPADVAALREAVLGFYEESFGRLVAQLGAEYFRSQGFEVVDARLADLPNDPSQIEPAMVVEWVAQHLCHRAEAVFIGGNGFQAARAIHHLERRTGRLVLEANQVLLWSVLENAGALMAVRGFGMLFDDRQPDGNKTKER
jgi:maleate isomerase